jgi:hypothetical protein
MPFSTFVVKEINRTHGSSVINHKIRIKLKLTMEEYCLLDLIHRLNIKDKPLNYDRIERYIGMDVEAAKVNLLSLFKKGLVERYKDTKKIIINPIWSKIHNTVLEDDFEVFWRKEKGISWTGSKSEAKVKYKSARESYTADFILEKKRAYFEFLSQPEMSYRTVMNAARFLNPKNEHFNESWEEYLSDLIKKRGKSDSVIEPGEPISEEKRKELFGG